MDPFRIRLGSISDPSGIKRLPQIKSCIEDAALAADLQLLGLRNNVINMRERCELHQQMLVVTPTYKQENILSPMYSSRKILENGTYQGNFIDGISKTLQHDLQNGWHRGVAPPASCKVRSQQVLESTLLRVINWTRARCHQSHDGDGKGVSNRAQFVKDICKRFLLMWNGTTQIGQISQKAAS